MNKDIDAGVDRIRHLEEQLARAPINSGRHRLLARAIRIEAELYRKSLDTAQALNTSTRNRLSRAVSPRGVPGKSRRVQ